MYEAERSSENEAAVDDLDLGDGSFAIEFSHVAAVEAVAPFFV